MKNSLKKIAKDTNIYLKKYLKNQKKSNLLNPIKLWTIFWWKKNLDQKF